MQTVQYPQVIVDISEDANESTVLDLTGATLEAIITPDITSTAIRFLAAPPSTVGDSQLPGTFLPLTDAAGDPYEVTVADNTFTVVDHDVFVSVRWLKLDFQSAELADRTITLAVSRER
jgi:hypothetical protein